MGVGEAVTEIAKGLKEQPLALALVVVNVMFLCGIWWLMSEFSERGKARDSMIVQLLKDCRAQP